jgi:hypothetical protein
MHRNPVKRGLVAEPQQCDWSSYRHYADGERGIVAGGPPLTIFALTIPLRVPHLCVFCKGGTPCCLRREDFDFCEAHMGRSCCASEPRLLGHGPRPHVHSSHTRPCMLWGWLTFAGGTVTEAAPPFAIFEGWDAMPPAPKGFLLLRSVQGMFMLRFRAKAPWPRQHHRPPLQKTQRWGILS